MKRFALFSVFASLALLLGGCSTPAPMSNRLSVMAYVDGSDVVKVRGDQIWIIHKAYELPGRWMGVNEPVIVNGDQKWFPNWNGTESDRYTIEEKDRALPLNREFTSDTLDVSSKTGLGNFFVSEYPNKDNNYTLSVTLDDRAAEGASWYGFGLDWDDEKK